MAGIPPPNITPYTAEYVANLRASDNYINSPVLHQQIQSRRYTFWNTAYTEHYHCFTALQQVTAIDYEGIPILLAGIVSYADLQPENEDDEAQAPSRLDIALDHNLAEFLDSEGVEEGFQFIEGRHEYSQREDPPFRPSCRMNRIKFVYKAIDTANPRIPYFQVQQVLDDQVIPLDPQEIVAGDLVGIAFMMQMYEWQEERRNTGTRLVITRVLRIQQNAYPDLQHFIREIVPAGILPFDFAVFLPRPLERGHPTRESPLESEAGSTSIVEITGTGQEFEEYAYLPFIPKC